MGVTGLWRLIEPAGKPVPVETLENKVLAVDISIWLHQMVKGYQDAKGAPLPNAHLMGLFQRLCKLLYFRIKPVFVFDGAFPELKKQTIAKRQDSKAKYYSESERLKRELALLLGKKTAVSSLLGKQISPKKSIATDANRDDIFKLPALPEKEVETESESDEEDSSGSIVDLHSIDVESETFKSLPVKDKYNLLVDLKETRKMNSWGKIHELPKKSDNFSDFQMQRLLKRRKVQECLEETEKEMGEAGMSLAELETLLNEEGIDTKIDTLPTRRIASDNTTRILMINNVKQALEDARKRKEALENPQPSKAEEKPFDKESESLRKDELQEDLEKAVKMSLEITNEADISACTSKTDDSWTTFMTDSDYTDSEEEDGFEAPDMTTAKAYIMQYSDFTHKAITDLVGVKKKVERLKPKLSKAEKIIQKLNREKSVIVDNINLSSDDDDYDRLQAVEDKENPNCTETNDLISAESVEATQASVICVENSSTEIISLDTSSEGPSEEKSVSNEKKTVRSYNSDTHDEESAGTLDNNSELITVSKNRMNPVTNLKQNIKGAESQDSDSSTEDFIELDGNEKYKKSVKELKPSTICDESDTSDDDFEEVLDTTREFKKPVVQINLKIGEDPGDDDIFADIFIPAAVDSLPQRKIKQEPLEQARNITKMDNDEGVMHKYIHVDDSKTSAITNTKSIGCADNIVNTDKISNMVVNGQHSQSVKSVSHGVTLGTVSGKSIDIPKVLSNINETNLPNDDDDELQKAIQMSLECVPENEASTTKSNAENENQISLKISTEQLNTMAEEIQQEEQDLLHEKGRLDRIGRNITEQMTKEAQELLQIFGIPYIVAPMEAEAQCAFLESVNLTDGTITDDSDIWLFGGRTVYKNFFNQKKHVLQFLAEKIERSFNLTREQLILLALLVGSDYTTGVTGVGPVTALEILASFPFNKRQFLNEPSKQAKYAHVIAGLEDFKKWVKGGKRTDNTTLKKKLKNVDLNEDFPSIRVVQAYMEPNVEKSEEKFTWGELDITILRDYAKAKFGWSQNKLDEIIKPVLKRLQDRKTQRSVQDYFKRKVEFQSLDEQMSKRVKAAVQRMGPEQSIEASTDNAPEVKATRKRKGQKKATVREIIDQEGPSNMKKIKSEESDLISKQFVTVVTNMQDGKSSIEINIPKTDRFQEIIPQREKEKQSLLQNKLKAIEIFRKTNIDKKKKPTKKRVNLPKEKAELSESSDSD